MTQPKPELPELPEPEGWLTDEAQWRLRVSGGNGSRGTVPLHARESNVACNPLFTAGQMHDYAIAHAEQSRAAAPQPEARDGERKVPGADDSWCTACGYAIPDLTTPKAAP